MIDKKGSSALAQMAVKEKKERIPTDESQRSEADYQANNVITLRFLALLTRAESIQARQEGSPRSAHTHTHRERALEKAAGGRVLKMMISPRGLTTAFVRKSQALGHHPLTLRASERAPASMRLSATFKMDGLGGT